MVQFGQVSLAVRKVGSVVDVIVVWAGSAIKPGGIGEVIGIEGQKLSRNRVKAVPRNLIAWERRGCPASRTGAAGRGRARYAFRVIDRVSETAKPKIPAQHPWIHRRGGRAIGLVIVVKTVPEEKEGLVSAVVNLGDDNRTAEG